MAEVTGSLTADAIVAKYLLQDRFDRVVSGGWGGQWYTYDLYNATVEVDGSVAKVNINPGYNQGRAMFYPGYPGYDLSVRAGIIQFDLKAPSASDGYLSTWFWQGREFPFYCDVWDGGDGKLYYDITCSRATPNNPETSLVFEVGAWYTGKWYSDGFLGGKIRAKMWKRGDPEPDWQLETTLTGTAATSDTRAYFYAYTPYQETFQIDNVLFVQTANLPLTRFVTRYGYAVIKRLGTEFSRTIDSFIAPRRFGADAWIIGGRNRHSRLDDHFGTQPDSYVFIDGPVGPHPSGTDLHTVLLDIVARLSALEDGYHRVSSFDAGAIIAPWMTLGAVIKKTITAGNKYFFLEFELTAATTKTATADAYIASNPTSSLTAAAWIIDLVC
jgi:hypothetical protein